MRKQLLPGVFVSETLAVVPGFTPVSLAAVGLADRGASLPQPVLERDAIGSMHPAKLGFNVPFSAERRQFLSALKDGASLGCFL